MQDKKISRFPRGGLGMQHPARTLAHSPLGVKENFNFCLGGNKKHLF